MNAKKREKVGRIKSSERVKERETGRIGKREKLRNIKSSERVKERETPRRAQEGEGVGEEGQMRLRPST